MRLREEDLIKNLTFDEQIVSYLKAKVTERKNILICGGTGAGKTKMFDTICDYIPKGKKVLICGNEGFHGRKHSNVTYIEDFIGLPDTDYILLDEHRDRLPFTFLERVKNKEFSFISTIYSNSSHTALNRYMYLQRNVVDMTYTEVEMLVLDVVDVIVSVQRLNFSGERTIVDILEVNGFDEEKDDWNIKKVFEMSPINFQTGKDERCFIKYK